MKSRGRIEFFGVIDGALITYGGYTNLIHSDRNDHMTKNESESIKKLLRSQQDCRYNQYVDAFESMFGCNINLPTETTCCWCLLDHNEEYIH